MKFEDGKLDAVVIGGNGSMGRNHVRCLKRHPNIGMVAVVDIYPQDQKEGELYFRTLDQMYASRFFPSFASVVVPTLLHESFAMQLVDNNIPVFVEKPLTPEPESAQRLIDYSISRGVPLLTGLIELHNPAFLRLCEKLANGEIGIPISIESRRIGVNPPRSSNEDIAIDLGIHDIGCILYLLGNNYVLVDSRINRTRITTNQKADISTIDLKFKRLDKYLQGFTSHTSLNWVSQQKERILTLTTTKVTATVDYVKRKLTFLEREQSLSLDEFGFVDTFANGRFDRAISSFEPEIEIFEGPEHEPLYKEIDFFIQCLMRSQSEKFNRINEIGVNALKILKS